MTARVFVTQEAARKVDGVWVPQFDLTPAMKFGEIVVLMPGSASLFSTVPTVRCLREKLHNFSDEDFILPMGDPSIMAVASAIAAHNNGGKLKILKWDRGYAMYVPLQIDISGKSV